MLGTQRNLLGYFVARGFAADHEGDWSKPARATGSDASPTEGTIAGVCYFQAWTVTRPRCDSRQTDPPLRSARNQRMNQGPG
jgi:hypothetical protein